MTELTYALRRRVFALALAASFTWVAGAREAAAEVLASPSFRLSGALVAGGSEPAISASATLIGGSAAGIEVGLSIGDESGVMLFGGLWPALVGAAFDQDRDLRADVIDNCTLVRNTLQPDVDVDGYGNACDADVTNDGIVNFADLAQLKRAFFTDDPIADLNADGVVNFADLAIMKKAFFKKPGPAAGRP